MRFPTAILLFVSVTCLLKSNAAFGSELSGDDIRRHSEAIALARSEQWTDALQLLAELRRSNPTHLMLRVDEAVVLAWSGRNQEAAERAIDLDPTGVPTYGLEVIAKAFRNVRMYDHASAWYTALTIQDPENFNGFSGLVMTLADANSPREAANVIDGAPEGVREHPRFLSARAYLFESENRHLDAVRAYDEILGSDPGNEAALRGKALALRSLLLPSQALEIAHGHPGVLTDDEISQLEADVIAIELRYSSRATYPEGRRYDGIDIALANLERQLQRDDLTPSARRRLTYDRVVALGDRLRTAEAVEAFEALNMPVDEVPSYVVASAGTSYLQERRPHRALELLESALSREPDNLEYRFRLFFVYTDLERHDLALDLAESLLEEVRPVNQQPGSPVVKSSQQYLRAAILKGLAVAYADQLDRSQDYFEDLAADAPHNQEIRSELATIYRWRGWTNRSLREYQQVLAVDPDSVAAAVGRAHAKIDAQHFETVEADIEALKRAYPNNGAVINLDTRWQVHKKSALWVDANFGENSGNTFGQEQYSVDASWLSSPLTPRTRLLLSAHYAFAEFPEGNGYRRRVGGGIDYRYRRWSARASVTARTDGGDLGIRSSLNYRLSDVLRVGARLETESNATPLRGARVGVSSNLVGGDAIWVPHESTRVDANINWIDLSDGNQSLGLRIAGEHRLLNLLSYDLEALASIDYARNEDDAVSYFSPLRSIVWMAGLRNEHMIYRRYDFALSHALIGRAGQHNQKGFGSATVWDVEYRAQAQFNDSFLAYVGINRASNVYDGNREYRTAILAGFGGRF